MRMKVGCTLITSFNWWVFTAGWTSFRQPFKCGVGKGYSLAVSTDTGHWGWDWEKGQRFGTDLKVNH